MVLKEGGGSEAAGGTGEGLRNPGWLLLVR